MEEHAAYHLARANIMEKILQEGNIKDLKSKNHKNYRKSFYKFIFSIHLWRRREAIKKTSNDSSNITHTLHNYIGHYHEGRFSNHKYHCITVTGEVT